MDSDKNRNMTVSINAGSFFSVDILITRVLPTTGV